MFNVQWCRPLSVDVVYIRLALCPHFGVRTMFLFLQSRSYKYFRFYRQLTSTVENVSLIVALGQILCLGVELIMWIWNDAGYTETC